MKTKKNTILVLGLLISMTTSLSALADYYCDTCTGYWDSSIYTCDTCYPQPSPSFNTAYSDCNSWCPVESCCHGSCALGGFGFNGYGRYYGYGY